MSVLIGGVFDPLHAGHLAYIREALTHGRLSCVLSDAPHKHPSLVPINERADLLYALGVDTVYGGNRPMVDWLKDVRPDKYIKGKDWEGRLPTDEVSICDSLGIEILYTDTSRQSSSQLLADYERRRTTEKLAAFEQWATSQPAVIQPWVPVTPYDRETREAVEMPHANAIAEVFAGMSVLDFGCGFGYLVDLLRELGMDAHGWDPVYRPEQPRELLWPDVTICREVLEHLPAKTLARTVRDLVNQSKKFVYVTTRFTSKPHLLDFDTRDDLDPTHITMLNQDLLRTLFVLEGCTRRPDLEARLDHMKKGRVLVYEVAR